MSDIWVAPFFGELGWETSIWAPWLRHEQDRLQVPFHVICEDGKGFLYEDFAEVLMIPNIDIFTRDAQHAFEGDRKWLKEDYINQVGKQADHAVKTITPPDLPVVWPRNLPPTAKWSKWHSYKTQDLKADRVAIHARDHQHNDRNWPRESWEELVLLLNTHGYKVDSIGHPDAALHIEGSVDIRGVPLNELAQILSTCEALIGPSSGPLAFGLLCETPIVWWSANAKDESRFAAAWNPFDTDNCRVERSWNPSVRDVFEVCQKFL